MGRFLGSPRDGPSRDPSTAPPEAAPDAAPQCGLFPPTRSPSHQQASRTGLARHFYVSFFIIIIPSRDYILRL